MSALEQTPFAAIPAGLSDERLALRVPSDPTAFTELHERYEQPLLRYTRSLLRDHHDAADAAQDAWTRAFAVLRAEPVRVLAVRAWLFAIARNACMDRLRDGKRCMPADIDERALGTTPGADDVLELRARAREALNDLAGLSERQRAAVVLRELNGIEGDELARALRTDVRRASWLLTDARRSLAEVRSGRGLTCEATRHALEHSRVRNRAVRAHIAGCPACDGFARRRVAARVHLHGIALVVLALPARLRSLFAGGLDAVRPVGAIAAATLVAGVPAIHVLEHQRSAGPRAARQPAATAARHAAAAAPAIRLPAAGADGAAAPAPARHAAMRRGYAVQVHVRATAPRAGRPGSALAVPVAPPLAPAPVVAQAAAPVRRIAQSTVARASAVAPVAAPVVRAAADLLARVAG